MTKNVFIKKDIEPMDIRIDEEFIVDYDYLPSEVRRVVDKYINVIAQTGWFPNNAHVHKARGLEDDIWIAYITRTKQHFRLLFYMNENEFLFHRILKHDDMDIWLKT